MDSQTCTRFSGKVGHEPKDSWLTIWANWQKGGMAVGVACNKKAHYLCPATAPPPPIIHQLFVVHCRLLWEASLQTVIFIYLFIFCFLWPSLFMNVIINTCLSLFFSPLMNSVSLRISWELPQHTHNPTKVISDYRLKWIDGWINCVLWLSPFPPLKYISTKQAVVVNKIKVSA